jgi:hypothetical protein
MQLSSSVAHIYRLSLVFGSGGLLTASWAFWNALLH